MKITKEQRQEIIDKIIYKLDVVVGDQFNLQLGDEIVITFDYHLSRLTDSELLYLADDSQTQQELREFLS